jgi:hypothetical protein
MQPNSFQYFIKTANMNTEYNSDPNLVNRNRFLIRTELELLYMSQELVKIHKDHLKKLDFTLSRGQHAELTLFTYGIMACFTEQSGMKDYKHIAALLCEYGQSRFLSFLNYEQFYNMFGLLRVLGGTISEAFNYRHQVYSQMCGEDYAIRNDEETVLTFWTMMYSTVNWHRHAPSDRYTLDDIGKSWEWDNKKFYIIFEALAGNITVCFRHIIREILEDHGKDT